MQHEELAESSPSARRLLDALSVLATVQKSSLVNLVPPVKCSTPLIQGAGAGSVGTPGRALNKDGSAVQSPASTLTGDIVDRSSNTGNIDSNSSSSSSGSGSGSNNAWTFGERIAVLAGLCEVLKASPAAAEVFNKVVHNTTQQLRYILPYCAVPKYSALHSM